jgi:hypothetical protein
MALAIKSSILAMAATFSVQSTLFTLERSAPADATAEQQVAGIPECRQVMGRNMEILGQHHIINQFNRLFQLIAA